jgi:DNA-directed RNA polymerase alpha subunit
MKLDAAEQRRIVRHIIDALPASTYHSHGADIVARLIIEEVERLCREVIEENAFLRGLIHDLSEERGIAVPQNFDWKEFTSELSTLARNSLKTEGIDSLEKLCNLTREDVLGIRNIWTVCLGQIEQALAKRRLSLRP